MVEQLQLRFYTERYNKENKSIVLREKFTPTLRARYVTGKFYARHDAISKSEIRDEFVKFVTRRMVMVPTDIYRFRPVSNNMDYGWFGPVIPASRDKRIYFGRKEADFIKHELHLRELHKCIPADKFTGVAFKT